MNEKKDIIKKFKKLIETLKKHNIHYYNEDSPIISDDKFDKLKIEAIEYEKKYSFLKEFGSINKIIGSPPSSKFKKV